MVLGFGNYAGDRLNFGVAADRLIAEGIDTRIVYVTDDIASAEPDEQDKRRGIAGTFTVYKIAGAAAEDGCRPGRGGAGDARGQRGDVLLRGRLRRLHDAGRRRSRCSPSTRGQMDFGLGIHGEPGISSAPWMSASELAGQAGRDGAGRASGGGQRPGRRAASTAWAPPSTRSCSSCSATSPTLLEAAGVELVAPEVGELVTSLDMAGCSLSVTWLDEELERLWLAPADTPAFRRGSAVASERFTEPGVR